jgi:hypothetical protein
MPSCSSCLGQARGRINVVTSCAVLSCDVLSCAMVCPWVACAMALWHCLQCSPHALMLVERRPVVVMLAGHGVFSGVPGPV